MRLAVVVKQMAHCFNLLLAGQENNHISLWSLLLNIGHCLECLKDIVLCWFLQVVEVHRVHPPSNVNHLHFQLPAVLVVGSKLEKISDVLAL